MLPKKLKAETPRHPERKPVESRVFVQDH